VKELILNKGGNIAGTALAGALRFDLSQKIGEVFDALHPWQIEDESRLSNDHLLHCRVKRHKKTGVRKFEIAQFSQKKFDPFIFVDSVPLDNNQTTLRGYFKSSDQVFPLDQQVIKKILDKFGVT
jgi:hypothetical protein